MSDNSIPDDVMEMLPEFLQESEEHLQVLNEKMLEAEAAIKSGQEMSQTDLNTMFRSAHTIKGTASFIGLKRVVGLTHKAETLLQKLRDGALKLSPQIVDVLFAAFDTLTNLLKFLRENKTEGVEIDGSVQKIEAILNPGGSPVAAAQPVAEPKPAATPQPPAVKPASVAPQAVSRSKDSAQDDGGGVTEKYLEQFISEAEGNLDELDVMLLKAEKEQQNVQLVNEIFRVMHTIKGSSGIVNAKPMADLAHKIENILHFFRSQNKPLPADLIPSLFNGKDALKAMVNSLKNTRKITYDAGPVGKELDKCSIKVVLEMKVAQQKSGAAPAVPKVQEIAVDWSRELNADQKKLLISCVRHGQDVFLIETVISSREAIKSMRLAMIEERLNRNGRLIAVTPSVSVLDGIKADAMVCALFCSNVNEANIREILAMDGLAIKTVENADEKFISSITGERSMENDMTQPSQPVPVATVAMPAAPGIDAQKGAAVVSGVATGAPIEISTIKIDSRKLDKLMNLSGELVIVRSQYARLVGLFNNDLLRQKDMMRMAEHSSGMLEELSKEMAGAVSGGGKDLSRLQKMVGELKVSLSALYAQVNHEEVVDDIHTLSETTSSLEKIASDLQAGVMQTRMVPIEGVFTRFKRIVRDISKDLNKDVNLKIEGAETELDKKIVDGLGDPLTHMIRNAVDHGLEDRETRQKCGKPETGTILLRASHKGNSMCIEIGDDGKGMDPARIAAVAVKKGVITDEQSARMSDKEKLGLIFLPGFSTAEKVTGL
ncbi:MAG: hypothetical protein HGA80_07040, partial [Candidatus Omnitrophica bacterium]|nr:hypothetical protein [Candidatus Omnitrophota bacterium]